MRMAFVCLYKYDLVISTQYVTLYKQIYSLSTTKSVGVHVCKVLLQLLTKCLDRKHSMRYEDNMIRFAK